jgi:hypothetical protein
VAGWYELPDEKNMNSKKILKQQQKNVHMSTEKEDAQENPQK